MNPIDKFKAENPSYKDIPDIDLTTALHKKYYSDVDFNEFSTRFLGNKNIETEDKGGLGKAFGAGVDQLQELGYRAVKGFTDSGNDGDRFFEKDGALSKFAQEGIDRNIEEQKAYEPTVKSYKDVDSVGSAASYAGELIANSVPYMAGAVTPVGAATMAGGLSQEAYEAQPEDEKSEVRALTSGVGQMALERLGIKGSLGDIGKEILKDGVIATAKRYGKGEFTEAMKDPATAVEFGKRVLKGSVWEGSTEAMQESLAMWGAGKDFDEFDIINRDKNSDDILGADGQRLMESFVGGATAGGVIRTGSESAQKLISWQQKSAPIAKNGIDELVKQGVTQDEAVEQVRSQLIASAMKQGLTEVEAAAAAARTMKQEYDIDHEIFTPVANDVASRRKALYEKLERDRVEGGIGQVQESLQSERAPSPEELVQQQMQANDPEFFNQLNEQSEPVAQEVNNITEKENNLPLAENTSIPEKDLQNESQVIDPFADEEKSLPQEKGKGKVNTLDVVEAPVGELTLSNDVPQFKSGANEKGVVEPLGGKFDRTGVSPIQVWVRKDGRKEVISGRHRTELAQRSGEQTIPAQYHYEKNGFDKYQAAALDAILNVREGQGKVKDYVDFIKHTGLTEAEANEQGILARATGKRAYTIASQGSDTLITAHRNNGITDEAAVRISKAAPNDEALQAVGIKAIDDGKTIAVAENMVKAVKSFSSDQQQGSGDLFGFDDSAMIEAENLAKAASKKQAEIQRSLSAIQGAAKRPDLAKKEGVNVKNPKAVQKRIEQLKEDKRQWDNWHTNPELVAQLKDKPDIPQEQTPQTTASQEAVSVSDPKENNVNDTGITDTTQEPDMFGGTNSDQASNKEKSSISSADNAKKDTKKTDSEKSEAKEAKELNENNLSTRSIDNAVDESNEKNNLISSDELNNISSSKESAHRNPKANANKAVTTLRKIKNSMLANKIAKDYKDKKATSLLGLEARTTKDIAVLAQVYRNPSFETFRVFFVKDSVIVGQTGVTSRMPSSASIFPSKISHKEGINSLNEQFKNLNADGYYLMHNHPSGNIKPSKSDIEATEAVFKDVKGFLGHVIVNEKKYAVINNENDISEHSIDNLNPEYDINKPLKSGKYLGTEITGPQPIALIGTEYYREDFAVLIGRSGSSGVVSGIMEINLNEIKGYSKAKLIAGIKAFQRQTGSGDVVAANVTEDLFSLFDEAIESGWLLDAMDARGLSRRVLGVNPKTSPKIKSVSVNLEPTKKTSANQENLQSPPSEQIDDFGEKLGGARKDTWGGFAEKLDDNTNIKTEPLSKSLPQPNYEKMAEEGVKPEHLAFIAIARDSIKAKPRASYKLGSWVKHVENVKSQIKQVLNNEIDTGKAFSALSLSSSYGAINGAKDAIAIIAKAHPSKLKDVAGYRITSGSYSVFKGVEYKPSKTMFNIEKKGTRFNFDSAVETLEEAQKNLLTIIEAENKATTKKGKHSKVSVYRNRTTGDTYLGWKGASGILKIKSFESTSEARSYLENNRDEVEETLQKMKSTPDMRKPINAEREGPERSADNVTPSIFGDAFGFRGVEFGNWVDQGKRQKDLNQAYDSLMDLAEALDIPPKALSLNGQLGLAFGARGKGGKNPAAAHYEPGTVVINLTKKAGSGSLAHEWWHALDNYFGKQRNKTDFITDSPYSLPNEEIRPEMARAFKAVRDVINDSDLPTRSNALDQRRSKPYWSTVVEMTARSFETFIINKLGKSDISNDYLANVVSDEAWSAAEALGFEDGSTYPYPKQAEQEKINDAYQALFDTIEHKKTDDGVALFSRDNTNSSTTVSEAEANQVVESIIKNWVGNNRANDFVVVSTFDDLPKNIKDAAKDQGAENDVRGVFHKGKTYLVRDKLKNQHEVEETIFHETYGHHGIRKLFGKEIAQKLNQLLIGIGGIKGIDRITKKYNINLDAYKKGLADSSLTNEQAQTILMDELLAHLAQNNKPSVMRKVKEIVGAIRQWLKKSGFVNLSGISDSELFYVLKQAREAVKSNSDNNLNDDIRFSISTDSKRQSSVPERLSIQEETTVDFALRKAQDKFRRLKVIQRELSINEDNDTHKAEEAIHGKVKNDIENIETKYVDKIAKLMAKNKLSQNEVDLYAIAKHAEERNAYIDTINPDLNGAGSGMSNEAAQAILDKAIVEEKRLPLEEITNHIYSMLGEAREIMVKFGLEPQDAVDTWQRQYKYYVPLKGYANDEATQAIGSDGKKSKQYKRSGGFNVKGRETIKAMGRRSLAESPLLHAVSDTTRAIIRARTNEVGNTFLKMVEENPDPNLWEVFSDENPDHRRGEIKKDGETVIGQIPVTAYDMKKDKETYFATKVKGVEKFVKIHDPLLMRAMGNLGVEPMGYLTQAFGNATRFLSALNTTWNITFAPSNFVRDIQSAIANIVSENQALDGKIKDVDGFAFDMVKFIPQSLAVVRQGTVNKDFSGNGKFNTPELSAYFKEFLESGAKTGWVNQENIDQLGKNLGRAISRESNTKWGATQRGFKHIADFVENYNDIIENGTRFSAYYNARKRGVSVKRASSLAKNLTVNFNRKGEIGNGLNAFYMFANANIQGNANLFRALFSRKNKEANVMDVRSWTLTQQLAVSAIGATVGMSYLMSARGGDDEDGIPYYDKIPNYIKNTNFIFMTGGVNEKNEPNYISIPMPYGYNILASIGHAIYDSTNTNKSKASIASNLVSSVLSAFSPIGMEESESTLTGLTRTLTPTLAKPFVEITANENFFGGKIVYGQDGYATKKANANLGTDRTWEWTKNLTSWLNDVTDGGTYRSGAIDITPQHIEHVLKFVGGGALQTALRTIDAGTKAAQGKEIARKDIPLLRRFYKSVDKKAAVGDFYDSYNELKKYKEDHDLLKGKDRAEFRNEYKNHLILNNYGSGIEKALRSLNKRRKAIEASQLSDEQKEDKLRLIDDRKIALTLRFSKKKQELGLRNIH